MAAIRSKLKAKARARFLQRREEALLSYQVSCERTLEPLEVNFRFVNVAADRCGHKIHVLLNQRMMSIQKGDCYGI